MDVLDRKLNQASTREDFRKVVGIYDLWSRLTESRAAGLVLDFADPKGEESVLEVACGTGVVFEQLVRRNPEGRNVGIDLSPDMLAKAAKRLQKLSEVSYELMEGDALELPFRDETFDLVVNNFMVDLLPVSTFDRVASEFYRVLKPGGRLVMSTFSFGTRRINHFWFWVAKHFPDLLTGCRPVQFHSYLVRAGFLIEQTIEISQNTFPSQVIKARKRLS